MSLQSKDIRFRRRATDAGLRGLTLVELLIAAGIAGVVLASIFGVASNSSRNFRIQAEASDAIDRLNFTVAQIKADLRRAAYLGVPNSNVQVYPNYTRVCHSPSFPPMAPNGLQAVFVEDGGAEYAPTNPSDRILDGEDPDRLTLLGAFRADRRFRVYNSSGLSLQVFNEGNTLAEMQYAFDGGIVAVNSLLGGVQFVAVGDASATSAVTDDTTGFGTRSIVRLANAVQLEMGGGDELCRFGGAVTNNLEAVPLHFVRYDLREDLDETGSTSLVREELDAAGNVVSAYIVARNIVDFQVWFDGVGSVVGTTPQLLRDGASGGTLVDDDGAVPNNALNGGATATPERARFAYIQLSTRLDTRLPNVVPPTTPRGPREFIQIYDESSSGTTIETGEYTHVMTVRAEVELTNFSLADI